MGGIHYCKMSVTSKLSNLIRQSKYDTFGVQFVPNRDFEPLGVKTTQIEVVHGLSKLYGPWKLASCYTFIWIELFPCLFSVLNVHSRHICSVRVLHSIILLHGLGNSRRWIVTYFQGRNSTEFRVSLQAISLLKGVGMLCPIAVSLKCDCTFIKKVGGGETHSTLLLSFDKTLLRHWEVFLNRNPLLLILTT